MTEDADGSRRRGPARGVSVVSARQRTRAARGDPGRRARGLASSLHRDPAEAAATDRRSSDPRDRDRAAAARRDDPPDARRRVPVAPDRGRLRRRRAYGVSIDYHHEHSPLGTAGALAGIDGLDEPFLMMNGDLITTLDYARAARRPRPERQRPDDREPRADGDDRLRRTRTRRRGRRHTTGGGIHREALGARGLDGHLCLEPRLLRLIEPGDYLDFPDLVLTALAAGERSARTPMTASGSISAATRITSAPSRNSRTSTHCCSERPRVPDCECRGRARFSCSIVRRDAGARGARRRPDHVPAPRAGHR